MEVSLAQLPDKARQILISSGWAEVSWDGAPKKVSRNTSILIGKLGLRKILVKLSRNSVGASGAGEVASFELLQEVLIEAQGLRAPSVLAFDPDSGIVITDFIEGNTISELLIGVVRREGGEMLSAEKLAFRMGTALRWFHDQWDQRLRDDVRLYCDFSPKNIMVEGSTGDLVFIDPPAVEQFGKPEKDIALSLFELSRVPLRCVSFAAFSKWGCVRRAFIEGYNAQGARCWSPLSIDLIHREEQRHFMTVLENYCSFYRFSDWYRQLARAVVIVPLLVLYRCLVISFYRHAEETAFYDLNNRDVND